MSEIEALWGVAWEAAICEHCDWSFVLPVEQIDTVCPHCHETTLTPLPEADVTQLAAPELVTPFSAENRRIRANATQFVRSIRFKPADLTPDTLLTRLQPLFLPMWLVDADVSAIWQAETGFDYDVVSHEEQFAGEKWQTREKRETRIRWEQRVGRVTRHYDNVAAPALEQHEKLKTLLGPFDNANAESYRPDLIDEAFVRLPNRVSADAWPDAEPTFLKRAADDCRRAATAQHLRQFRWQPEYSAQNWTQLLVPVYTSFYRGDDGKPLRVLINGQSGRISGMRRASMQRAKRFALIIGIAAILLFTIAVLLLVLEAPFAGLAAIVAVVAMLGALFPIADVAQFNRSQRNDWFAMQTRDD
jgi:hypothetical protein